MKPRDSIWPLYDQTWAPRCGFISGIKLNWTPMVCFFLESMITDNENDDQNLLLISVYNLQWMFGYATQIYMTNVVYELYVVFASFDLDYFWVSNKSIKKNRLKEEFIWQKVYCNKINSLFFNRDSDIEITWTRNE